MKTLVVLCSLVAIAIAAPALQDEIIEDSDHSQNWNIQLQPTLLDPVKREKKSPLEQSSSPLLHGDIPSTEIHIDSGNPTPTARSFGLKKSLIVKKKHGYRLYRDSDEEKANADSHETCGRQVKVKLCDEDGKFREMLRSTGDEISDINTSEDEMKNRIMMAKEAVENLQRDLQKMEQKSESMKMAHGSEADAALHEDIEVARQALDHIHKNFGNVDTMNLDTTATRDSEATHDLHVTVARSEEEQMARWKEAMETIQKNVEIVRNIEDSFKVAHDQSLLDQSQSASSINEHRIEENVAPHAKLAENHMRGVETTDLLTDTTALENHETQLPHEHFSEHHAREDQHIEDDMKSSASEAIQMKTVDIDNHHILRSDNHRHEHEPITEAKSSEHVAHKHMQNIEKTQEHIQEAKSSESQLNVATPTDSTKHLQSLLKETEEPKETKLNAKSSENIGEISMAPLMDAISTLNAEVLHGEHQRNTEITDSSNKAGQHFKHEKVLTATVKHVDEPMHHETNLREVTEQSKPLQLENIETKSKHASHSPQRETEDIETSGHFVKPIGENFMKAAHPSDHPVLDSLRVQHKHHNIDYNESEEVTPKLPGMKAADDHLLHPLTSLQSADNHLHHHHHHHHLSNMKATEDHLHHLESEPVHTRWAHGGRHLSAMKAAAGYRKDIHEQDHKGGSHLAEHHHGPNKMGMTQDFDMSDHSQHHHYPSRYHHNSMSHSQMHEANNIPMSGGTVAPNYHSSMRDAMEALESEHMFRWKPSHESSRNAYGAGISSSIGSSIGSASGAVGVFPTANTGGCGIPLLLSCSPSVVSGSLAKAHAAGPASYAAPSYRTEEDFSFHNKRDIKKSTEMSGSNILRTPAIVKQKTSTALENNAM